MSLGDFLNWEFIMPHYTNKQKQEILKELKKMKQKLPEEQRR